REGAELRQAKETLAFEATQLTHGEEAAREAQAASRALFVPLIPMFSIDRQNIPTTVIPAADFELGLSVAELFVRAGLVRSRNEARRLADQKGASIDGKAVTRDKGGSEKSVYMQERGLEYSMDQELKAHHIPTNGLLLRAGKKRYQRVLVG
ncbi:MAG TPA: hypothetical protein VIG44_06225, partial [Thermomicrobiales bacterium]